MTLRPIAILLLAALAAAADGPRDNVPENVRPIPPAGVPVEGTERTALERGVAEIGRAVEGLRASAGLPAPLADVEIYLKALRYALDYGEFLAAADVGRAKGLVEEGLERARRLARGEAPWLERAGPTALGYVSAIDGSVQPYGLYLPQSYAPRGAHRFRLDVWFHGRSETLGEVSFIDGVARGGGPFVRPDTFVLQPYGRYCNANKLAGEIDLFEALEDVKRRFRIDPDRIVVRGFSMGGAAVWHVAAHYASEWAAAAPGAGFSETPEFLKVFQQESLQPPPWERKLWQLYDCPVYAANFSNVPVVAYSGEIDRQRQAAEVMARALEAEGIRLVHILGPQTAHSYHPEAKLEIDRRIDSIVARGRVAVPRRIRIATPTLRYDRQAWVRLDALGAHWEPARLEAEITGASSIAVRTSNVTAFTLEMAAGDAPFDPTRPPAVTVDGTKLEAAPIRSDRSWTASFHREKGRWLSGSAAEEGLRKRHGLQGPIDDAFLGSFLVVRPTGTPLVPGVARWAAAEMERAILQWRRHFRGDARVADDRDVTEADIAAHNLALWGDPGSNAVLGRIAARLPIRWSADAVAAGGASYPAATHAPILVYPNPLQPERYVVVNSGFTFREYDYLNNARQVPKLPDWAIVDITTPANSRYPGRIASAGFFDERWLLPGGSK